MAKLSVAIAILKNKPAAQSASDYTKSLASSNLEQMLQWEDKCQELEKLQQDTQLQCVAIASCSVNQSNTCKCSMVYIMASIVKFGYDLKFIYLFFYFKTGCMRCVNQIMRLV